MSDGLTNGPRPITAPRSETGPSASGEERPQTGAAPSNENPHTNDGSTGASPGADGKPHNVVQPEDPCAKEITRPPKVGDKDPSGAEITNIYASTRQFVIYEADEQVRYILPCDFDVAKGLRLRVSELGGLRASIEDWRCDLALSPNARMRAAREVAWALAQAFEDENNPRSGEPKEILSRVDSRLRSLVKSHYRKKYCIANLFTFGVIEIILIVVAIASSFSQETVLHRYASYGCFGGLGAFLSVITGLRSIDIDVNLSRFEHLFAGATRILIGVIGAVVIGLALDSHLIDPTFGTSPASPGSSSSVDARLALSLILAFIAGFSESLVPNMLRRGENAVNNNNKQDSPDAPIVKDMKPG
jgi:hypothetical protein